MARISMNQLVETLRGKIGGLVFRRLPDGSIVVSGAPFYRKGKGTPNQKAYRSTFRARAKWAKWAAREYPIYAQLAATRPMITAYNMALSDSAHPPVIHRIIRGEGCILVQASDDVMVNEVKVGIRDEGGKLLEWGSAVRKDDDWWEFITQIQGKKIEALARDLPGNSTSLVVE